ncbi:hypothetical protein KIH39_25855 [Telmatocola sphagniphila]|uniref:Uncharacterized protein n=1 Tax=Telmatocola sphagniphila TaxID=1123043 RepID=A0A8E6B676_9BACT|nr:hypothetical protein [Telmatocola sphagniphila]QVL32219.1 hypothetical protein KIH39_25855 [Telmatocola sphagniphila]
MKYILAALLSTFLIVQFAPTSQAADLDTEKDVKKTNDGTVTFVVRTKSPKANREEALEAGLEDAQAFISNYLHQKEHCCAYTPSIDFIRQNMLKNTIPHEEPFPSSNSPGETNGKRSDLGYFYTVELQLEMPQSMEQQFRKAGRVVSGLWALGCSVAALLVIGAFFRLDEWTKGYLTTWLVVGSAGLISVFIVLMFL